MMMADGRQQQQQQRRRHGGSSSSSSSSAQGTLPGSYCWPCCWLLLPASTANEVMCALKLQAFRLGPSGSLQPKGALPVPLWLTS
eukprot:COSAG01_NODE_1638_length_9653_cov_230.802282_10_plen_85_part_00